ncbi:ABC transporter ATP-binding protein [Flavihumibacter profundi]|uniref:ABC transporter ATP-binding protein n=1 Tax=Flavihumibacter profundi TaxID=2716883 RepID=UPI001CC48451|nr:ABC transporter ATP-binding protein [Flavihumibacter profundi]MBZ5859176.1 ABC transporter ATP-binding protein [Flavihumibacter profundi]
MQQPLLTIQDLTVDFNQGEKRTRAIDNITFTVNRGEIVAIVGESGSGKSVTSLSLLQLLPQKITNFPSGKLLFSEDGKTTINLLTLSGPALRNIRGSAISMIFQEPMTSLNPVFTCGNQVIEAIRAHQEISTSQAREQCLDLFRKVRLPDPERIMKCYPHEISGGQKQRVMIAMAISCDPALLIADEPTTALDVTVQKSILELLASLQAQTNMGLIFISHDLGVVKDIAHRVVVMYRGKIVEQNTTEAIFNHPAHPYTKALLACRPILHPRGRRLPVVSDFWQPGNNFSEQVIAPAIQSVQKNYSGSTPLLQIDALKVWFPTGRNFFGRPATFTKAVDGISFNVLEGETLGVVGESGCGKTTLGRALLRLIPVTGGQILHRGKDLLSLKGRSLQKLRKDIQIVFQDPYASLNPRITVGEAIKEAMQVHGIGANSRERKEKVVELLEKVNLQADHFNRFPHTFSGGQRQRIGIARALALNPGFIVFDESVSALDVSVQAQVLNLINDLKAEFGFTALFISHDLGVVRYISDRILVMQSGRMAEIGPAESVFSHPQSDYTKNLLDSIPGNQGVGI